MDFEYAPRLPRVLCLHGGGTSAAIFKIQTRYLQWSLGKTFEFVFFDAPWPSPPGPGVVPVFEEMGPFFRWAKPDDYEVEEIEPAPPKLEDLLRRVLRSDGGEWVGVMGFSQGGRLAAGLLRECQEGFLDDWLPAGETFKFGLLSGASYPPIYCSAKARQQWPHPPSRPIMHGNERVANGIFGSQKEHRVWDEALDSVVRVPSIHIQGMRDPVLDMSKLLLRCFDERRRKLFLLDIGHHLPKAKEQNRLIADAILEAYRGELDSEEALADGSV